MDDLTHLFGNCLLFINQLSLHVVAAGDDCPQTVLHTDPAVSAVVSEAQRQTGTVLLHQHAVFVPVPAMPLLQQHVSASVVLPRDPLIEHHTVFFQRRRQLLFQFPKRGIAAVGAASLCICFLRQIPRKVVGIRRLTHPVRSRHRGQPAAGVIGVRKAFPVVGLRVVGFRHHMADPVALAVIEDALASPVRVMDADVVPIAVIVIGGSLPVIPGRIVGIWVHPL